MCKWRHEFSTSSHSYLFDATREHFDSVNLFDYYFDKKEFTHFVQLLHYTRNLSYLFCKLMISNLHDIEIVK